MNLKSLLVILLVFALAPGVPAQTDGGLDAMLKQLEAAQLELVRGRPDTFKAMWSQREDVTLIGGLGGAIERGWPQVSRRLDWVATQYSEGTRKHEEVSRIVVGELASVVQRETIRFRAPGQAQETTQELRATMVFRLEAGRWRLVHRHADSQIVKKAG